MKTRRATTITLEIPQNPIPEILSMVQDFASDTQSKGSNIISNIKSKLSSGRNGNKFKNYLPIVIVAIVALGAIFFVGKFITSAIANSHANSVDNRVELKGPRAKMTVNKTFEFPLKDDKGKTIATLKFLLGDAELRDEIILQGQKAVAVKGRTYLITTIKLTNSSDKFIQMKVRNYVRLNVNGNKDEWLAAEIHNDPVEVQPESTKQTRLGFPINDTDKDLILRVGDLEGKKESIPLNFN